MTRPGPLDPRSDLPTHRVENQPAPRVADLWADAPLRAALQGRPGAGAVQAFAAELSDRDMQEAGRDANRYPPELRLFDRGGRRLDEVAFHPAYHRLMALGLEHGYAAIAWENAPGAPGQPGRSGGHVAHAAMVYLLSQVEPGVCCPMTMTYAGVPVLAAHGMQDWTAKLTARRYDPAVAPLGAKTGATLGMAMTEKQGGSDVRANTTRAEPARGEGEGMWRLTGHKWFCSAPMSDGFLTLAQAPGGLTCFLAPRWLEPGQGGRNAIQLMRLKDKLGNRSNASAEIEYVGALARQIGEEGAGVRTIIEMVHHTRLDTALAPAGLMRAALAEALHWCAGRTAFQRRLIDQPLMRAVLADLALDVEGALALGLAVAEAFDDPGRRPFARIGVALAKFLSNKRAPGVIYECMETLGGMGYVEDTPLPLLFRESPLNSIWEGSGNVICLDILRTLAKEPEAAAALAAELDAARGADTCYDAALETYRARWPALPAEAEARSFAERTAVLLTASVLMRRAPSAVAEGYVIARLEPRGSVAGAVAGLDTQAILARADPSPD